MGSSDRLFSRQRTVHEIFGGGFVADVVLWRQNNITIGIFLFTLASWVLFEISHYTLLSLISSVFLLLFVILFVWAKSAALVNRPAPPLPQLHLSEEMTHEVAALIRTHVNALLSVSQDIALGKDTKLFFKVSAYLCLTSVVGGLTDFVTLIYTSIIIILTVPALYERYEDYIDYYVTIVNKKLRQLYVKFYVECIGRVRRWVLEKQKLS